MHIEKWIHSFLTTAPQQADVTGNILLSFYKKKTKQNKKIIKYYPPRQLVVGLLWKMSVGIISLAYIIQEKWFLHSFLTTAPQQADVAGSILLFFYKKKKKQNKKSNKILLAMSACCGAIVRNECRDHFSK
jgi:hypothetical protein